jgi:AcrR family transcriptional regulator
MVHSFINGKPGMKTRPRPKMRRKRKGEGPERRSEILQVAKRVFLEEGYSRATIRRIASQIGISSTALYVYFPDKNSILREICTETFTGLTHEFEAIKAQKLTPLEALRAAARAYIAFGLGHPHEYELTFVVHEPQVCPPGKTDPDDPGEEACEKAYHCLLDLVADAVNAGVVAEPNVDRVAQQIWAGVHGLVALFLSQPEFPWKVDADELIRGHVEMLVRGIAR